MVLQILAVIVLQQKNKKIRIDSYNSLSIEETITFHNVIILIKLFVNTNKSNYYYNIFLEKGSQEDKSNICLCITKANERKENVDLTEKSGTLWLGMASSKPHKYCTVIGRVPKVS